MVEVLNGETKKIENRRDQEAKKHELEKELIAARNGEVQRVNPYAQHLEKNSIDLSGNHRIKN